MHAYVRGYVGVDWDDYRRSKDSREEYWKPSPCSMKKGNSFVRGPQTLRSTLGQNNGRYNRPPAPNDTLRQRSVAFRTMIPATRTTRMIPLHVFSWLLLPKYDNHWLKIPLHPAAGCNGFSPNNLRRRPNSPLSKAAFKCQSPELKGKL